MYNPKKQKSVSGKHAPSVHASISFTAHYTGHMWQKLGLSHPALATKKGKFLHQLFAPIDTMSQTFFGVALGHTLTVRHKLMDKRAKSFIQAHPHTQVVEIAAGLSPRGWRFLHLFDDIDYHEVDLPAMSALKAERLPQLPYPVPVCVAADIFTQEFDAFLSGLDQSRPLLIISEGLINYFSLEMIAELSKKLARALKPHPHGLWLTENYPLSDSASMAWLIKYASGALKAVSKSAFSFYFHTPTEAANFFKQHGFSCIDVYQPSAVRGSSSPENSLHAGDTVWVLEISHS